MNLASCLALKEELFDVSTPLAASVASAAAAFKPMVDKPDAVLSLMNNVALGVVRKSKKKFYLAVRTQFRGPEIEALVDQISKRAKQEVDVRYIGRISALAGTTGAYFQAKRRPLMIGSSISDVSSTSIVSAGSLGCFVKSRTTGKVHLLTNNHVIAGENSTPLNTKVVQPGELDQMPSSANGVAKLSAFVKLKKSGNKMDAALAAISSGISIDAKTVGNKGSLTGAVAPMPLGTTVHKVGRTTGQTTGKVTAFAIDNVQVSYHSGIICSFDDQIEISSTGMFSTNGDSGSLIFNSSLDAVGLLFASNNGGKITYANPLQAVLDKFKVDLV